ncbi:S1 family peptidase [Lentzea sp. BCCO 10_0856]|uniref:S1 family peptidase n=1 Tax=Lentzea miocenica TaxID=3095431 RepID=A0ABU4T5K7_9PSEU|nr:S1 family peptidase [Lentzea sp. BCCO 10_0856]MDX8033440.1 S1 family peptidase [Lentzea sp. BCCO 10_0856]
MNTRFAALSVALLLAGLLTPPASADAAAATTELATSVADRLEGRTAGSYRDSATGKLVVAVTDAETARAVRAAGAAPRFVARSGAVLQAATEKLDRSAAIPGTSWGIDPRTNQVLVSADGTVTGAKLARLRGVLAELGDAARLEHVPGAFTTTITGGDAIYGGPYRCSLGFNVNRPGSSTAWFLTAGHCANAAATWSAGGGQVIGTREGSSFPGNDYALIRHTSGIARPGAVNLYNGSIRDISGSANAYVGQSVARSGSTTGYRTGQVTGLNVTVNYSDGTTVTGMIRTTVCAEGGDSGGALVAGNTALGLTSGGSGNCSAGGTTFFQPVVEALNAYNVRVY